MSLFASVLLYMSPPFAIFSIWFVSPADYTILPIFLPSRYRDTRSLRHITLPSAYSLYVVPDLKPSTYK